MDTPIFDGVLGDRLATARQAVEQAGRDADAFAAALDAGQTQALGQLVELRARALVAERTSKLTDRVSLLERELQAAQDRLAVRPAPVRLAAGAGGADPASTPRSAPVVQVPGQPASDPAVRRTARTAPAVPTPAPAPAPTHARPAARESRPTAAPSRPTGVPVPAATAVTASAGRPASPERTGRKAADEGPTGEDVPTVPSMRDLFAGSRAASWLDGLMGARR